MRLLLAVVVAAMPHLTHVPLGHGIVYVHPVGASSRVSCSSPRATVWGSYDTMPWEHTQWHVNVCFTGEHIPYEAIISQHGREVECVFRARVVTRLSDCT